MKKLANETIEKINEYSDRFRTDTKDDIETVLKDTFDAAFRQADTQEKKKKLYTSLSLFVHPDRKRTGFLKTLEERGLGDLSSQVLNRVNEQQAAEKHAAMASYHPWRYIETQQNRIKSAFEQAVIARTNATTIGESEGKAEDEIAMLANEAFFSSFRNTLPELYRYEQYHLAIQYLVYGFAFSVNAVLAAGFMGKAILDIVPILLHKMEVALLNYSTDGHYDHFSLDIAKKIHMRALLEQVKVQCIHLSDEDVKAAYDGLLLHGEDNQRSHLEEIGFDTNELSKEEFDQLFKQVYIAENVENLCDQFPESELLSNEDIIAVREAISTLNELTNTTEVIEQLKKLSDTRVNNAYSALRKFVQDSEEQSIKEIKTQLGPLSGTIHASAILFALQDAWNTDVAVPQRFLQAIVLMATLPLIAIKLLWDGLSAAFGAACILLKVASVTLINAPLDVRDYFSAKSDASQTPAHAAEILLIQQPSNDGDFAEEVPVRTRASDPRFFAGCDSPPGEKPEELEYDNNSDPDPFDWSGFDQDGPLSSP